MKSTREKMAGGLIWTLLPRIVQMAVSVFTSILMVRSLGESDYGRLSILRTALSFAVLFISFGFGQALNRFVPELRVRHQEQEGRALLWRCLLVQSAIWIVLSGVLVLTRGALLAAIPNYADLFVLGVLLSICEVIAGTVSQYAVASYRTRENAAGTAIGSLVLALTTAYLFHLGLRIPAVLYGAALGNAIISLLVGLLLFRRIAGEHLRTAVPGVGTFSWPRLLAYAVPWMPNNLINFIVWRQSETILLGLYRSQEEAGFFDIAYKLPQLALEFLPMALYPLVLAGFSETATIARERMADFVVFYFRLLFFILAPIALFGLSAGDVLVTRMYGEAMAPAGPYCQIFFLVFTAGFIGTPLSMAVYVAEKVWLNLLLNLGYGTLVIGLDLLLIPRYGLLGALLPTAIVTLIVPVVRFYIARPLVSGLRIPWRDLVRVFVSASPVLACFWLKRWVHDVPTLLGLFAAAALLTLAGYRVGRALGSAERSFIERSSMPFRDWILKLL